MAKILEIGKRGKAARPEVLDFPRNQHTKRSMLRHFALSTSSIRTIAYYYGVTPECLDALIRAAVIDAVDVQRAA